MPSNTLKDRSISYASHPSSVGRYVGIGFVILIHVGVIYALVNGLAQRAVDVVRAPIETKIIDEVKPERTEPPPPPPPPFTPPSPPFVPPPEIHIERPVPPQSTAPTVVTTVQPLQLPPPPGKAAEPVRVLPKVDLKRSQEPDYPPRARRFGQQGTVTLEVLVDTDGQAVDSKLVQSCGIEELDNAALTGVKTSYRFTPGTVDGKPEKMWYTFRFTWKIR